jgi:phosphatidylglycerophosphate synthase
MTSGVTVSGFSGAVRDLAGAQKASAGAPGYSRFINRRIGRYLAAFSFVRGWTPNQVTVISAAFTYLGIAAIAVFRPSWPLAVLVTFALVAGYAFDSADGQLARLRGGGSRAGEWLDHIIDCAKIAAIHLVVLISFYRFFDLRHHAVLLLPLAFEVVASTFFFGIVLTDQLRPKRRAGPTPVARPDRARDGLAKSLALLPNDYGIFCLLFLTLPLRNGFLWLYAALFALQALYLLAALVRWYRELRSLDGAVAEPGRDATVLAASEAS